MVFTIGKTFSFAAAHHLPQLPEAHKCHNVHGHNYLVSYELQRQQLDDHGFVADYAELTTHWQEVSALVDHKDLNVVMDDLPPTAEHLAWWLFDLAMRTNPGWVRFLRAVRVQETPTTFGEYRP